MEFRGGRGAQNAGNHECLGVDSLRDCLIQYGRQCWMGQPIGCTNGLAFHGRATGGLAPPGAVVIQLTVCHEPCSHPARCRRRRRHRAGRESIGGVASSQLTTAPGRASRPVAFFQPCKFVPAPQPIPEEPPPLGSFAGLLAHRDGAFGQGGLQPVKAGTGTMCNLPTCNDDARRVYRGKTKSFIYCQAALNLCGDAVCLRLWVRESRGRNSPRSYSCLPVFGCGNPRNRSGVAYCSPPMRWLWSCERGARGPEGFIVRRVFS